MVIDTPLDDTNVIEETPTPVEADSTPDQEDTPDPVSEDAAEGTKKEVEEAKPSRAQQRIQQLVEEKNQAIADKKYAMEFGKLQQDDAERLRQQLETRDAPAETPAPVMPKLEDFEYDQDDYNAALQTFNSHAIAEQVRTGVAEAMRLTSQTAAATQVDAEWKSNLATFSAEHEDFDEVAYANEAIYDVIKTLPDGPEIAYALGQNMELAHKIAALPESQLLYKLGEFANQYVVRPSEPVVAQKQATKAPDPMSPSGGGQPTLSLENESMDDFMVRRNAEEAQARKDRGIGRV